MAEDKRMRLPQDFYKQVSDVLGNDFWEEIGELVPVTGPRIDIYHSATQVVVLAELPGLQTADQIGIHLEGQTLILEGEVPCLYPVTENKISKRERFFGRFERFLPLPKPVAIQDIKAHYSKGLLIIEMTIEASAEQTNIPLTF